jgi:hypothetical protein
MAISYTADLRRRNLLALLRFEQLLEPLHPLAAISALDTASFLTVWETAG